MSPWLHEGASQPVALAVITAPLRATSWGALEPRLGACYPTLVTASRPPSSHSPVRTGPLFLQHYLSGRHPPPKVQSMGTSNPLLFPRLSLRVTKSGSQDRLPRALPGSFTTTTVCWALSRSRELQSVCVCRRLARSFTDGPRALQTQLAAGLWRCAKRALACQGRAMAEARLVRILETSLSLFKIHTKENEQKHLLLVEKQEDSEVA